MNSLKIVFIILVSATFLTGCDENPNLKSSIQKGNPHGPKKPSCDQETNCVEDPWKEMFNKNQSKNVNVKNIYGLWNSGMYNAPNGTIEERFKFTELNNKNFSMLEIAYRCKSNGITSFAYAIGKIKVEQFEVSESKTNVILILDDLINELNESNCEFSYPKNVTYIFEIDTITGRLHMWPKANPVKIKILKKLKD